MHTNSNHKYRCHICLVLVFGLITLATLLVIRNNRQEPLAEQYPENLDAAMISDVAERTEPNVPFLRGEDGSYIKDLSNSYMSRIFPHTQNVKSMLSNDFVQVENKNTINTVRDWRKLPRSTKLGDRNIPIGNITYFMGVDGNGKLRVGKLDDFTDENMVVRPVWNRTRLVNSYHDDGAVPYYMDTDSNYINARYTGAETGEKTYLVAPNGNSLFLNYARNFTPFGKEQKKMINDFLKRNNGAYPIQVDNGSYSEYLLNGKGQDTPSLYERYVSGDFYRDTTDLHILGEIDNN